MPRLDNDGSHSVDDGNNIVHNNETNKRRKIKKRPSLQRRSLSFSLSNPVNNNNNNNNNNDNNDNNDDDSNNVNNLEKKKVASSSLFGAVMERSSTPSRSNKVKSFMKNSGTAASSSNANDARSTFFPMSPSSSSHKKSNDITPPPSSPGGMELLKVLQGVGQDWLSLPPVNNKHGMSPTRSPIIMKEDNDQPDESSFLEEWNECPLFYNHDLDWSIKHIMKLDIYPSTSSSLSATSLSQQSALQYWQHPSIHPYPFYNSNNYNNNTNVSTPSSLSRQPSISSTSNLNNNTNLSRQTSMTLTRQASITSIATATSSKKEKKKKKNNNEDLIRRLIYSVRSINNKRDNQDYPRITFSQMLRLSGMGCLGGLGDSSALLLFDENQYHKKKKHRYNNNNNNHTAVQKKERMQMIVQTQRQTEWKECFQSLFWKWLSSSSCNNNENRNDIDFYFYSTTPGQTLLFRHQPLNTKNQTKNHDINNDNELPSQPVILVSSTTSYLRCYLQNQLKITLHVLSSSYSKNECSKKNPNDTLIFQEEMLDQWSQNRNTNHPTAITLKVKRKLSRNNFPSNDDVLSYNQNNKTAKKGQSNDENDDVEVLNDLEELRRATAHGEAVGEEYFVNNNNSNHNKNGKDKSMDELMNDVPFPPLMIIGKRDCLAFFEFYWNTCGCTHNLPLLSDGSNDVNNKQADVPLLYCPLSCGPCPFMTLKTLSVANVSKNSYKQPHQQQAHSTIEIRGPIMPSALKEIASYVAKQLLHHKQKQKSLSPTNNSTNWDKIESILTTGEGSWLSFPDPPNHNNGEKGKMKSNNLLDESSNDDNNVGSHYFVIQLHTHGGEIDHYAMREKSSFWKRSSSMFIQQSSSYKKRNYIHIHRKSGGTGTPSSAWFNLTSPSSNGNHNSSGKCNYGKVLNMIVWDITRPSKLAFKTESADSFLFQ